MNLIDRLAPAVRTIHGMMTRGQLYNGEAMPAFVRGYQPPVDMIAGAQQQDRIAVIDAAVFAAKFPARPSPQRLDKMTIKNRTYTVEEWRGSPADEPVFFKVLLRGGTV